MSGDERPSPESIGRTVCDAFDHFAADRSAGSTARFDRLVARLHETLVAPDPERGLDGLLWVLANDERYVHQNLVGELLLRGPLPCARPLEPLLDDLLPPFDASSRKTVEFLVRSYGHETVRDAVRARQRYARARARQALDCMAYWLGDHPADAPAARG